MKEYRLRYRLTNDNNEGEIIHLKVQAYTILDAVMLGAEYVQLEAVLVSWMRVCVEVADGGHVKLFDLAIDAKGSGKQLFDHIK